MVSININGFTINALIDTGCNLPSINANHPVVATLSTEDSNLIIKGFNGKLTKSTQTALCNELDFQYFKLRDIKLQLVDNLNYDCILVLQSCIIYKSQIMGIPSILILTVLICNP